MLVRHRTWRSSSALASALAFLGKTATTGHTRRSDHGVPLELAHAVSAGGADEEVLLGLTTPLSMNDAQRLVIWERCETDGDCHTVYLRGTVVDSRRPAPEASIVLRPRSPGHYRVVDDLSGLLLHHFHVPAPSGAG